MATKPLKAPNKKKAPAATSTSSSIDAEVKAFLKAGGKIEKVNSGVSGQGNLAKPKSKPAESSPSESK